MEIENIKKALTDIERVKNKLNYKAQIILEYREMLTRTPISTNAKVRSSEQKDTCASIVAVLVDHENEYEQIMLNNLRREISIYNAIAELEPDEQKIIVEGYIHGMPWYRVAQDLNYSDKQIRRRRDRALKKLIINGDFAEDT